LARVVTADMQAVNRDRHLFLEFSAQEVPVRADGLVDSASLRAEQAVLAGHGFARIERLAGNVGLIDIRKFYDPGVAGAGAAAVAAMSLVASADALIIDLRRNLGGEPEMVALVSSFLFDSRTHLVDLEFPGERRTVQYWTDAFVPEPTFGGTKPVIVLTSERTVSGGEGMSYQLQQSRRATVVGDRTAGAANFHYPRRVGPHLISGVPSGYPVDPHSGGNWEGVGVQPDVPIPAEQALAAAYERALEGVLDLGADGARAAINADAHQALIEQRSA
jgi:C-terminal processing protease CtpA/Prc